MRLTLIAYFLRPSAIVVPTRTQGVLHEACPEVGSGS